MFTGSLKGFFTDRSNPLEEFVKVNFDIRDGSKAPMAPQLFGNAGIEHMEKYGTKLEHFGKIAEKNHRHSVNNPYSQFRDLYTLEQIMKSPTVHTPLTKLQCCPTSDGAAAAIICSEEFVVKHNLQKQAVEILGIDLKTDFNSTFDTASSINLIGSDMAKACAESVYKKSGYGPKDI